MKMRQYEDGKRFCDAVVTREGVPGSTRVVRARAAADTGRARGPGRLDARTGRAAA